MKVTPLNQFIDLQILRFFSCQIFCTGTAGTGIQILGSCSAHPLECAQAIPIGLGLPLTTYITMGSGPRAGYYFSAAFVLAGTAMLSLIDVHKNNLRRRRRRRRRRQKRGGAKED